MDNFTKVYGTKWTNDTYIKAQWTMKESICFHMDNVNKLYGTKWTNDHTWMQSGLQKNPMETYGKCLKTLWNPMDLYRYLWNKMDIISKLHGIEWTYSKYN